jgi:hypothetical protein
LSDDTPKLKVIQGKFQLFTAADMNGLSKMLVRISGVTHTKTMIKVHKTYFRKLLTRHSPTACCTQSFLILTLGTLKTRSEFRPVWHPTQFWCLSNHSEPLRDFWNGLTFCDQTWFDSGGGHFEYGLWIVPLRTVRPQQILNREHVFCVVSAVNL